MGTRANASLSQNLRAPAAGCHKCRRLVMAVVFVTPSCAGSAAVPHCAAHIPENHIFRDQYLKYAKSTPAGALSPRPDRHPADRQDREVDRRGPAGRPAPTVPPVARSVALAGLGNPTIRAGISDNAVAPTRPTGTTAAP